MAQPAQSAFDFSDSYGSDPIMRRYSPTTVMDIRSAEIGAKSAFATKELAEANLAKAQADYNARLVPMRSATDAIKSLSEMMKTKSAMQEEAAIQRSAAVITEGLAQATDLESVVALGNTNLLGLKDSVAGPQWRNSVLTAFRQSVDNAQSADEVDRAYSRLPASVAFEPEFKGLHDIAKNQAVLRQTVREKFAAEPSLGAVPTTTAGGVDVTAAGLALAAKGGELARRDVAIENVKILQKQAGDLQDKLKQDEALGITVSQSDKDLLETYNRQIENNLKQAGLVPSATATTPATAAPDTAAPTAVEEGDVGTVLPAEAREATKVPAAAAASAAATGGITAPSATAPAPTTTEAEAPKPEPVSLEEEIKQTAEAKKRERIIQSVEPKLKAKQAARESRIEKAQRRARLKTLQNEKERLTKAIADAGLGEDSDVIVRAKNRIAEIDQELSN